MTRYEKGFLTKCAEYGVDGRALLMKNAGGAKFKPDGLKRAGRALINFFGSFGRVKSPIGETVSEGSMHRAYRDPRTGYSGSIDNPSALRAESEYLQALRAAGLDGSEADIVARSTFHNNAGKEWRRMTPAEELAREAAIEDHGLSSSTDVLGSAAAAGVRGHNLGRSGRVIGDALQFLPPVGNVAH